MSVTLLLQTYAQRIRELRRANADVPEPALAPAFQQLLEGLIPLLPVRQGLTVLARISEPGVGRPDIALDRQARRRAPSSNSRRRQNRPIRRAGAVP